MAPGARAFCCQESTFVLALFLAPAVSSVSRCLDGEMQPGSDQLDLYVEDEVPQVTSLLQMNFEVVKNKRHPSATPKVPPPAATPASVAAVRSAAPESFAAQMAAAWGVLPLAAELSGVPNTHSLALAMLGGLIVLATAMSCMRQRSAANGKKSMIGLAAFPVLAFRSTEKKSKKPQAASVPWDSEVPMRTYSRDEAGLSATFQSAVEHSQRVAEMEEMKAQGIVDSRKAKELARTQKKASRSRSLSLRPKRKKGQSAGNDGSEESVPATLAPLNSGAEHTLTETSFVVPMDGLTQLCNGSVDIQDVSGKILLHASVVGTGESTQRLELRLAGVAGGPHASVHGCGVGSGRDMELCGTDPTRPYGNLVAAAGGGSRLSVDGRVVMQLQAGFSADLRLMALNASGDFLASGGRHVGVNRGSMDVWKLRVCGGVDPLLIVASMLATILTRAPQPTVETSEETMAHV